MHRETQNQLFFFASPESSIFYIKRDKIKVSKTDCISHREKRSISKIRDVLPFLKNLIFAVISRTQNDFFKTKSGKNSSIEAC